MELIISIVLWIAEKLGKLGLSRFKFWAYKHKSLKRLDKLVINQIKKQKQTAKYIPEIFIENHDAKELCRCFTAPVEFWHKIIWEINKLDHSFLNRMLVKSGMSPFNIDLPENMREISNLSELQAKGEQLNKLLQQKTNYLNKLRQYRYKELKKVIPVEKIQEVWEFWYIVESAASANFRNIKRIQKELHAIRSEVFLINSEAGKGKTNFVCDFAENVLRRRSIPCLFLTARDLDHNIDNIQEYILGKIFSNGDLNISTQEKFKVLGKLCNKKKKVFVLIVDGLNESVDIKRFAKKLEEFIEEILTYDFIRIILTCRNEYFEYRFDNLLSSTFAESLFRIDNLMMRECEENELIDRYFEFFKLSYSSILGNAYYLLTKNPLLLRFYCEVQGDPKSDTIKNLGCLSNIHIDHLFENYLENKVENIARVDQQGMGIPIGYKDILRNALKVIVEYMIANKQYSDIPIEQIDNKFYTNIERFACEDIILRKDLSKTFGISSDVHEVINFTFDAFRDYLIAKYLVEIVWPKDKKRFAGFTDSLIRVEEQQFNGRSRLLYTPSIIAEGVSKFIFQIARHSCISDLEESVKDKEWYNFVYLESIFEIEDQYVRVDDVNYIKKRFMLHIKNSSLICYQLIHRYDIDIYKNLSIKTLFDILRGLERVQYSKLINPIFQNYTDRKHAGNYTLRIDLLTKWLRQELDYEDENLCLFELLIFLFEIPSRNYHSPALELYDDFAVKYPDVAIGQLLENLEISHIGIRIHIWEKLTHLLQKGHNIPGIKNLAKKAFTELMSFKKTEYVSNNRLAIVLNSIAEIDSDIFSNEDLRSINEQLKTNQGGLL